MSDWKSATAQEIIADIIRWKKIIRYGAQNPLKHDLLCEADWGSQGQESPCRCAERAVDAAREEAEKEGS